jgi:fatty-acyl-CoA synthase
MITANMTLYQALLQEARQHPEREALIVEDVRLTYGQLLARCEALAWGLHRAGLQPGERVASLLPPGWPAVVLLFALARLGAVAVPLNPQFRRRQLEQILAEVEPVFLFTAAPPHTAEDPATIREVAAAVPSLRQVVLVEDGEGTPWSELLRHAPPAEWSEGPASPDDLAVILYTSGTTGQPKGVMHSHRGLITPVLASLTLRRMWLHAPSPARLLQMAGLVARYGTRLLQAAGKPQTFLTALGTSAIAGVEVVLQALLMGDRLILMPHFHPVETLRWIQRERVTVLIAVPFALGVLVKMRDLERYDLSSLLICGTGSAPCPPELARQVQERFGCAVHIGFGTTEIGGGISATSIEDSSERQAETVGRPMPGMEVRVVDEQGRPLPPGAVGELVCRSPSRMLGYYRAPELTREVLDPEGWYHTGDLATMDEQGFIRIVGRKKDVIIRGGQNIYPAEIEHFLMSLPGIREAAVVGVPAPAGGEQVWAFIIPEEGATVDAQEVLARCRGALARYQVPEQVRFVSTLPRSALGKVNKVALRAEALQEFSAKPAQEVTLGTDGSAPANA